MSTDSNPQQNGNEQPTFSMSCPHCKKTTQCRERKVGKATKPGEIPHAHGYICTECGMGWGVQTGGGFDLNSLR